jgi:hypothetical protein
MPLVQRLVSEVKMATVPRECSTEELRSVVRFLWTKGLNANDIHKEMFPVYGCSVCRIKRFTAGSRNVADVSLMMKSLKSKDFYAAGLNELVKRWNKCMNLVEDMSRNKYFFCQL